MTAIEIARKMASLGQREDAQRAYTLVIQTSHEPSERLEAAAYILQFGGDYRISYTTFIELYNQGYFQEDILSLMTKVFYEPNIKLLKSRYERNCKLLAKYPYLFRKDFLPFEDLPVYFFPFDDHSGYVPFYREERRFGEFINFKNTIISQNFFHDLENPILAHDVYSQYELEYLNDNVRRSEDVARENHVYLHYADWGVFCSYLQCLILRPLLESEKLVFLIEDEVEQYPIDFKERFGIDYSQHTVQPVGVRELTRLIWHTQLSTHNGGDFFNEIFDGHPNLLVLPSVMMFDIKENVEKLDEALNRAGSLNEAVELLAAWNNPRLVTELYQMRDRTAKDLMVAVFMTSAMATAGLDPNARIAPAVFFQPHFYNIVYTLRASASGSTVLEAANYEEVRSSSIFRNFKYIKTFTPMRRFTTSHGATVRFMYESAKAAEEEESKNKSAKKSVVSDAVMERVLNRSFMIDPEDRLYKDSVLVRFEDGKLNPKATFTALAAFLDLPYGESMTCCSEYGKPIDYGDYLAGGFDPAPIYKTYDDYVNDKERYFIEYFLRDAYEYYGYSFHYYDGGEVDEAKTVELVDGFDTMDHYIRETWIKIFAEAKVSSKSGAELPEGVEEAVQKQLLENYIKTIHENRKKNAKVLMEGLHFVNKNGQPLRMMPKLELDPALLENPIYH